MILDLITPTEAAQAVLMAALLASYHGIGKLAAAHRARKKEYANRSELDEFKLVLLKRVDVIEAKFDSFLRQRMLEQDKVPEQPIRESGTLKVLLIEDDRNDRFLMHRAAPSIAFDDAPSLADGLRMLARNGYDCVILDIGLPGNSELEALKAVRERSADIPLVIWSGNENPKFPLEAAKLGCDGWIFKTENLREKDVVRAVRQAIMRKNA